MSARTEWPGLILPGRIVSAETFDAANSTYTEDGPVPGTVVTSTRSKMRLEAGGDADGATLELLATCGGVPGPNSARVATRAAGDSAWQGWDPPTSIHEAEAVEYDLPDSIRSLCVVRASWGLVCVGEYGGRYVKSWTRQTGAFGGSFGTAHEVFDNGSAYTQGAFPCLAYDPVDERVYCWWVAELQGGTKATVRGAYTDDGATWTTFQRSALRSPIDISAVTLQRMRAAWHDQRVLLLVGLTDAALTYPDIVVQLASCDGGRNFDEVDTWTGDDLTAHAGYIDLIVDDATFYMAYVRQATAGGGGAVVGLPYIRAIGSPYEPLSAAASTLAQGLSNPMRWGTLDGSNTFTAGDMALSADENGNLYVTGRDLDAENQAFTFMSTDGGATWLDDDLGGSEAAGDGPCWWDSTEPTRHPRGFTAAWLGGSMFVLATAASTSGIGEVSIYAYQLGGWTEHEMPLEYDGARPVVRASWQRTWIPIDTPDATGGIYTATLTGTPTITLDGGALLVVQTAGEATEYATVVAPPGSVAHGVMVEAELFHNDGIPFVEVRTGEAGPTSYTVRVRLDGGYLKVVDRVSTTLLGSVAVAAGAQAVRVHVCNSAAAPANDGCVTVWYRTFSVLGDVWVLLGSWATLQKGTATTNRVLWGCETGDADVEWYRVLYTSDVHVGIGWYGQTYPASFQGRDITPRLMDTSEAMSVRAISGPCDRGDQWSAPTAYGFGVANLYYVDEPSPSRVLRTTGDGDALTLQWATTDHDIVGRGLARTLGVWLGSLNIQTAEIWLRSALTGTWTKHVDVDTATGQSALSYQREGNVFRPSTGVSQAAARTYADNELAGAHLAIGTGPSRKVLRIVSNTGGAWYGTGTAYRCTIVVEGLDGTEPTSGSDLAILASDVAVLIHDHPILSGVRVVVPVQDTAEGYFQLKVLAGDVAIFGLPYSSSRERGFEPMTDLETKPGGARRARVRGPGRRFVEFGWEEGAVLRRMYGSAPAPAPISLYTNGPGVASVDDTPYMVQGIAERLQGGKDVMIYCSAIPAVQSASTDTLLVQRRAMMPCRLTSEVVTIPTFQGDECSNEIVRVGRIRLEEER